MRASIHTNERTNTRTHPHTSEKCRFRGKEKIKISVMLRSYNSLKVGKEALTSILYKTNNCYPKVLKKNNSIQQKDVIKRTQVNLTACRLYVGHK